jgi:uncharacterized coiled-coil protein SlyX
LLSGGSTAAKATLVQTKAHNVALRQEIAQQIEALVQSLGAKDGTVAQKARAESRLQAAQAEHNIASTAAATQQELLGGVYADILARLEEQESASSQLDDQIVAEHEEVALTEAHIRTLSSEIEDMEAFLANESGNLEAL